MKLNTGGYDVVSQRMVAHATKSTKTKKIARRLAAALSELDMADWHARDWRSMQSHIRPLRDKLSRLFTSTGYEYGARGNSVRIRKA